MESKTAETPDTIMTPEVAFDANCLFFPPKHCATTTVPPVATAIKNSIKKTFKESTKLTALTAATPDDETIAVFNNSMIIISA